MSLGNGRSFPFFPVLLSHPLPSLSPRIQATISSPSYALVLPDRGAPEPVTLYALTGLPRAPWARLAVLSAGEDTPALRLDLPHLETHWEGLFENATLLALGAALGAAIAWAAARKARRGGAVWARVGSRLTKCE